MSVTSPSSPSFIRSNVQRFVDEARELGQERRRLLGIVTGGHIVIHWFQQLFPIALPFVKTGLGLSGVQVGVLAAARQFGQGTLNLPCGMLGDALYRHRDMILASSLVMMGVAYLLFGSRGGFGVAFAASVLIGFGTALWHPTAAATLTSKFPQRRATAMAVHGTGATISDSLSPVAQGVLVAALAWDGVLWWHIVPGVLFGFLVFRGLLGVFRQDVRAPSRTTPFREMIALLGNGSFMAISASRGLLTMGRVVVITFLPSIWSRSLVSRRTRWASTSFCFTSWGFSPRHRWATCPIATAGNPCWSRRWCCWACCTCFSPRSPP